jgi:S-methylmethionine-dependent homocysteine/selenocysteine methylase
VERHIQVGGLVLRRKFARNNLLNYLIAVEEGWHGKNDCVPLEDYIDEWVKLGARYIGGCCRTGAIDIEKIKDKVEALKNK